MSGNELNRRGFLKLMGWSTAGVGLAGCDLPSTVTLEQGKETVMSYLSPEEYVIPGIGVWYASTCTQCAAFCGIHGRVREGHALKLEGNPDSPLNRGKLCQMGQAGIQGHYNPDRVTQPLLRKDGKLTPVSGEEAWKLIGDKLGAGLAGERFAWVTGTVSGHQAVLLAAHLEALGSKNHFAVEVIGPHVGRAVNLDMLGEATPRYALDKAKLVLSLGADFLGTWVSPTHFATEYAKFRSGARGMLVQVEPKMTLTGGNADLWVPIRPGAEGVLALAIAHVLMQGGAKVPEPALAAVTAHDPAKAAEITGVPAERIEKIAALLKERSPSLVLAGAPVEGHAHGYQAAAAVQLLNIMLGNVGQTIVSAGGFPFPQLAAKNGTTRDLLALADAAKNQKLDVVFFHGANPVYLAPQSLALTAALQKIPFKVAFAQFMDETTELADLVIPLASYLEDWGTHVAAYQPEQASVTIQQPLMERLYPDTIGLGDALLKLMKLRQTEQYAAWEDYYAYLRNALASLPAEYKGDAASDNAFWNKSLQTGVLKVAAAAQELQPQAFEITLPGAESSTGYPLYLVPSAQLGLWDGRHANLPWLQEAPDQISKVLWDSWAELHPSTAAKLGIKQDDIIEISSEQGSIKVKAYLFKGIHPDVVAVPMGQGHEAYGRYAKGRGVNVLKILDPVTDAKTGELALYATRVKLANTGKNAPLVIEGRSNNSQLGRKLVVTISADQFRKTEGA